VQAQSTMKKLLFTLGTAWLGVGCAEVISHADDAIFDAGSDVKDATSDVPEGPSGPCTSKRWWTGGVMASAAMTPGRPCIACHAASAAAPKYAIAGTVYETKLEEDDCNGADPPWALGVMNEFDGPEFMQRTPPSAAGNFFIQMSSNFPNRVFVKIVAGDKESKMIGAVTIPSDCNTCHSVRGDGGAAGRIVKPM